MSEATKLAIVKKSLRYWDPIGVIEDRANGSELGDDEYDSYANGVLMSVKGGADARKLADHLVGIRVNSMNIGSKRATEFEENIAEQLVKWRERKYRNEPDFRFMRYAI